MLLLAAMLIQADLTRPPEKPDRRAVAEQPLVELFSSDDYPEGALRRGAQGTVRVRLRIDPQGRAQACELLGSSHDNDLDAATCALLLERSRFRPARSDSGEAVADFVETRVRWALPDPVMPFEAARFGAVMRGGADGPHCIENQDGATRDAPIDHCYLTFGPYSLMLSEQNNVELEFEMRITPVRGMADPPAPPAGQLLWRYAGEITVAANGSVSRCTVTRNETGDNMPLGVAGGPQPCAFWSAVKFERQKNGRDLRRATFEGVFVAIRGGRS